MFPLLPIDFLFLIKTTALFGVDELSPVVWNDAAFDHLVLPGNEKHLAWNFVENQALANNNFDDFVRDKGRGIIILMYGPPGVGKTFTAEAVAERARVPLYGMSAGTLGTDPGEVEKTLTKALDLCELWNAMLLLDEADVFLTARTNSDLARNELVAIFLTKLEYYPGICFLTTNRISSLDHAFQSRVDLFLPYADLTWTARRQVWAHFINRTGQDKFSISEKEMDQLAEAKLNGREIKNLVKSAHLLSLKGGEKIGMDRVHGLAQNRLRALEAIAEQ
jgi:AAA+ superfamily predicted ATPase